MGEATAGTGTRTVISGDERPFLPGMSRTWLLPLYDPLTRRGRGILIVVG